MFRFVFVLIVFYVYYVITGFNNEVFGRGFELYLWCVALVIMSSIWVIRFRLLCCVVKASGKMNLFFVLCDKFLFYYVVMCLCSFMVGSSNLVSPLLLMFSCLISVLSFSNNFSYDFFWRIRVAEFSNVDEPSEFSIKQVDEMIFKNFVVFFGLVVLVLILS